jgi:Uma2 family endonuclease
VTKGEFSEPEPDICVVKGPPEQYTQHPSTAHLVVEVSKTSLRLDRSHTLYVYASMNVPDYWVLDLEHRQLHVHRQPIADSTVQLGHRYESVTTIAADGNVAPLERPGTTIAVADMLPPVISPDA